MPFTKKMYNIYKHKLLRIFIFCLLFLVLLNTSMAVSYGSSFYGKGKYGIGYVTPTTSTTTTPSSGGSAPSFSVPEKKIQQGVEKILQENWQVSFKVDGVSHNIIVEKITSNSATITISSTPITVTLYVGDERKFNLNNDSFYDLYVKLNSINGKNANFTIKEINETIPVETKTTAETIKEEVDKNKYFVLIIAGIVILAVIAVVLSMKHRKRK